MVHTSVAGNDVSCKADLSTILLAEDDDALRSAMKRALVEQGYEVVEASDGAIALRLGVERSNLIGLLVTDIIMPHLDGIELAEKLQKKSPGLKVLYMSGYVESTLLNSDPSISLLLKPFDPEALVAKVRELVGVRP